MQLVHCAQECLVNPVVRMSQGQRVARVAGQPHKRDQRHTDQHPRRDCECPSLPAARHRRCHRRRPSCRRRQGSLRDGRPTGAVGVDHQPWRSRQFVFASRWFVGRDRGLAHDQAGGDLGVGAASPDLGRDVGLPQGAPVVWDGRSRAAGEGPPGLRRPEHPAVAVGRMVELGWPWATATMARWISWTPEPLVRRPGLRACARKTQPSLRPVSARPGRRPPRGWPPSPVRG